MPKDVVAVLEIVDIDERHGNGGVLLPELLEGTGKAATVAKPGKLVGKGSPDQILCRSRRSRTVFSSVSV